MPVSFRCHCGAVLSAQPEQAGQLVRCPSCGQWSAAPPELAATVDLDQARASAQDPANLETSPFVPPPASEKPIEPAAVIPRKKATRREDNLPARLGLLAVLLAASALVQLIPIWFHGNGLAPLWMRGVILISAAEIGFALWMLTVPDSSTLWVATLLAAVVSAAQAFALALAVATPDGEPDLLQMNELRDMAELWLVAMLLVSAGLAFACGQLCFQWRKQLG